MHSKEQFSLLSKASNDKVNCLIRKLLTILSAVRSFTRITSDFLRDNDQMFPVKFTGEVILDQVRI